MVKNFSFPRSESPVNIMTIPVKIVKLAIAVLLKDITPPKKPTIEPKSAHVKILPKE